MLLLFCRPSSGRILEALHVDPASGVSLDKEKHSKVLKPSVRYFVIAEFLLFFKIYFFFFNIGQLTWKYSEVDCYCAYFCFLPVFFLALFFFLFPFLGLIFSLLPVCMGAPVFSYYSVCAYCLLNSFVYFYYSTSSGLSKLSKPTTIGGPLKQQGEKKETPQERLKRIMSKQLSKQSMNSIMCILVLQLID